jgi:cytochrome b involved in lipid metabolism
MQPPVSATHPHPGGQATMLDNALSDLLSRFAEQIAERPGT